jgi:hypothetical protein
LPDGRFIGIVDSGTSDEATSPVGQFRIIPNWTEELKRRVPAQ